MRQRPVQAIHIERAPTPRGLTLGCDAEAGPRPVPEPQQPENPGRSSAAGHLAFSYSPTMGHAVPTEPPKEDSPCARFRRYVDEQRPPEKGSLLRLEDVLGVPLALRLGPIRGREAHPMVRDEADLEDGSSLSAGRLALREMQELRREGGEVSGQLEHERHVRSRITDQLMAEREHWHLKARLWSSMCRHAHPLPRCTG